MYKQLLEVIFTPESMVTYRHEMHYYIAQAELIQPSRLPVVRRNTSDDKSHQSKFQAMP